MDVRNDLILFIIFKNQTWTFISRFIDRPTKVVDSVVPSVTAVLVVLYVEVAVTVFVFLCLPFIFMVLMADGKTDSPCRLT